MIGPDGEAWTLETFTEGAEMTAVWSVVDLLELSSTGRIDAEYYQPRFVDFDRLTRTIGRRLSAVFVDIIQPAEFIREYVPAGKGAQFWRAQNIRSGYVEVEDIEYIAWDIFNGIKKSHVQEGDVLITRTGANAGDCAVVPPGIENVAVSSHTLRLVPKDIEIGYAVGVFFASDYGRSLLLRTVSGSSRPQITVELLSSLVIPDFRPIKSKLTSLMRTFYEERERSRTLYAEAEALLLSELGLDDLDLSHQRTYTQNASRAWDAGRLDPEYFQPKYTRVETTLRSCRFPCCSLGELIAPIMNGFDYRDYVDAGTPYIRVGDVSNGRIDLEGAEKVDITIEDVSKDVALRPGDIVFTRKGTFGRAAVVREGQEHAIISSEIMRLRLKDPRVKPDYLALFLNSVAGYQQIEQRVHGVAFFSISQDDLASITVSIPSDDVQERVAQLVVQSIEAENEAKLLLEQAKRRVEEMVLGEGDLDVATG